MKLFVQFSDAEVCKKSEIQNLLKHRRIQFFFLYMERFEIMQYLASRIVNVKSIAIAFCI